MDGCFSEGGNTMRAKMVLFVTGLVVGLALLVLPALPAWAGPLASGERPLAAAQVEPGAGAWPTWLIASGAELRLPPPPDRAATQAELAELEALAARRDAAALDRVSFWDAGAPGYR